MQELTVRQLREWCKKNNACLVFDARGVITRIQDGEMFRDTTETLTETVLGAQSDPKTGSVRVLLQAQGYDSLALVLQRAFDQAATGKGKERHASGKPFDEQPMQELCDMYGIGFALGQAAKKAQEAQRLPRDAAVRELLGAINYIAGAVVALERNGGVSVSEVDSHSLKPVPDRRCETTEPVIPQPTSANDNTVRECRKCEHAEKSIFDNPCLYCSPISRRFFHPKASA